MSDAPALVDVFVRGLDDVLGDRLVGVIQYGAMCFPPSPVSDFDAHVFVADPFDDDDRQRIRELLAKLAAIPGGDDMDVWYVTVDEATSGGEPQTQLRPGFRDKSWALHRAHWHAGRFVLVRGPDPREMVPEPTWSEIDASLQGELDFIEDHLGDAPAFSVLNLCRVLYSYVTRDVVIGKIQSALWAFGALPAEEHGLIRTAIDAYRTKSYEISNDVRPFFELMSARVARAREAF